MTAAACPAQAGGPLSSARRRSGHAGRSRIRPRAMAAGGPQAAASPLRGLPRARFAPMTTPRRNSSPPQTPHGSARCSAPVRQPGRTGQPRHSALARRMSSGFSAKNNSGSLRQGSSRATPSCGRLGTLAPPPAPGPPRRTSADVLVVITICGRPGHRRPPAAGRAARRRLAPLPPLPPLAPLPPLTLLPPLPRLAPRADRGGPACHTAARPRACACPWPAPKPGSAGCTGASVLLDAGGCRRPPPSRLAVRPGRPHRADSLSLRRAGLSPKFPQAHKAHHVCPGHRASVARLT